MFEENTDFVAVINRFVGCWTKTYIFYTKKLGETSDEKMFVTEFSLPTKEKTIPVCTVKV